MTRGTGAVLPRPAYEPSPEAPAGALRQVLLGGATLFALQSASVLLGYITQVVLARWLGSAEFGRYTYAFAWATLLAVPAGLGLSGVVLRFVPVYLARHDIRHLHGLAGWSRRAIAVAGSGMVLLALVGGYLLQDRIPAGDGAALMVALAVVPLLALTTLEINKGHSFGRPSAGYLPFVLGTNPGLLLAGGIVVLAGVQLTAARTLALMLLVLAAVAVMQGRRTARLYPVSSGVLLDRPTWLRVGMPLMGSTLLWTLLERTDVLLVGTILGASQAGVYGAAARTALLGSFAALALTTLSVPRMAALYAQNRREDIQTLCDAVVRWAFWPTLAVALALIVLGRPLLGLYGAGFSAAWPWLVVLALGQVASAAVAPAGQLLNVTGYERVTLRINVAALLVDVAVALVLIPRVGALGAAAAAASAMVARSGANAFLVRRYLGLRIWPRWRTR